MNRSRKIKKGSVHTLYDPDFLTEVPDDIFNPEYLREQSLLEGEAIGRGEAYFFQQNGRHLVLRHFRRGGLVGKVFFDKYLGIEAEGSRAWREWRLLAKLNSLGLPVPRPVAARVCFHGCSYRADLITERIPQAISLADHLNTRSLPNSIWENVGQCVRVFHDMGVFHADLNARNILLNRTLSPFLIDFDRGSIRGEGLWKKKNLTRLHRSLKKFSKLNGGFHFTDQDWMSFLEGYSKNSD